MGGGGEEALEWDAHWGAHGRNYTLKCEADAMMAQLTGLYEHVRTTAADASTMREQGQLITTEKLEITPSGPPHAGPRPLQAVCLISDQRNTHSPSSVLGSARPINTSQDACTWLEYTVAQKYFVHRLQHSRKNGLSI